MVAICYFSRVPGSTGIPVTHAQVDLPKIIILTHNLPSYVLPRCSCDHWKTVITVNEFEPKTYSTTCWPTTFNKGHACLRMISKINPLFICMTCSDSITYLTKCIRNVIK